MSQATSSFEFRTPGSFTSTDSKLDVIHKSKTLKNEFFYLITPWIFLFQNILLVVYFGLLFIPINEGGIGYNIIVVGYIINWIIMILIARLVVVIHRKLKLKGYIKLNNLTYKLIFIPVFIWTSGLALLGLLFVFVPAGKPLWGLYAVDYLEIIVGFEVTLITFATVWYFVLGMVHNRKREPPDATSFLNTFHDSGRSVVDKQAEVIQKLQQNRETLELENQRLEKLILENENRNKPVPVNPADEIRSAELTKKINLLVARCGDLRRQLDRFEERGLDEIEHKCSQVPFMM